MLYRQTKLIHHRAWLTFLWISDWMVNSYVKMCRQQMTVLSTVIYLSLKAMLHEAIFLATCLATMTTEKHCKLQRGCHTFAIFLRNLQYPRWKLFTTLSLPAWNLLRAKDRLWLPNFHKIAWQVAVDMSNAATCLATLQKVEDISTFLATRNATFCCCCRGCYTWNLSCNLSHNVCCETSFKKYCLV